MAVITPGTPNKAAPKSRLRRQMGSPPSTPSACPPNQRDTKFRRKAPATLLGRTSPIVAQIDGEIEFLVMFLDSRYVLDGTRDLIGRMWIRIHSTSHLKPVPEGGRGGAFALVVLRKREGLKFRYYC